MYLDSEIDAFIGRMKQSPAFKKTDIIKAYPYVMKPTLLDRVVITVSPAVIDGKNVSLGEENIFAYYTIDADIFVPCEFGSDRMCGLIEAVLKSQLDSSFSAVATSRVGADDKISCLTAKCSFTYNGELNLGKAV